MQVCKGIRISNTSYIQCSFVFSHFFVFFFFFFVISLILFRSFHHIFFHFILRQSLVPVFMVILFELFSNSSAIVVITTPSSPIDDRLIPLVFSSSACFCYSFVINFLQFSDCEFSIRALLIMNFLHFLDGFKNKKIEISKDMNEFL